MDVFYRTGASEAFRKALRQKNVGGTIKNAPLALIETMSKPIMEYVVPRQKLGVFYDQAKFIYEQAGKNKWSDDQIRSRLQEAWDSVDNRMGQLVYDNLFWHRALKDLGMASVRSLGWNLGTLRELGGGIKDMPKQLISGISGKGFRMTPRMAYVFALPFTVGLIGGVLHYLFTGEKPEETKDYFFPKTGRKLPDGNDERVALPSYMKDIYSYAHKPFTTISHKIHPLISSLIQMFNNEDYFGYEIRNPGDPLIKQATQLVEYAVQQFQPFSFRNLAQFKKSGKGTPEKVGAFFGIIPASKYITNTPIQNKITELYSSRNKGTKPYEQREEREIKNKIRELIKSGRQQEAERIITQSIEDGLLTENQIKYLTRNMNVPWDVILYKTLPRHDKEELKKQMTLEELKRYQLKSEKATVKRLMPRKATVKKLTPIRTY